MSRFKHNASIVVSGLFGAVLVWAVLHQAAPTAPSETDQPAIEKVPEVAETPPRESETMEMALSVALPPPPVAEIPKQPARPKPAELPKTAVSAPAPVPAPKQAPEPETAMEPPPPEPVADPPAIHPLRPVETLKPTPQEPPKPMTIEPLHPAPLPERAPSEVETKKVEITPLKPMPSQPVEMPVARTEPAPLLTPLRPEPRESTPSPAAEDLPRFEPLRPAPRVEARAEPRAPAAPVKVVPRPAPKPMAVAPTAPAEDRSNETVQVSFHGETPVLQEGRALLRILEHGQGPTVEIHWPDNRGRRENLYRTLSACYGMKTVLMDGGGNLYVRESGRGQAWRPNMDRYSGFVRQPRGYLATEEQREATAIARAHGLGGQMKAVRLFPRSVDAALLGGLRSLIGNGYGGARQIDADYRDSPSGLFVENIRVDGSRVSGRIAFPRVRSSRCI